MGLMGIYVRWFVAHAQHELAIQTGIFDFGTADSALAQATAELALAFGHVFLIEAMRDHMLFTCHLTPKALF